MNDSFIDKWVIRMGTRLADLGKETGKAHLVESEITDRLVMKCGRELKLETPRGQFREFVARRLDARCKQCQAD